MRVLVHPADTGACGHYRLIWPGTSLKAEGYDVMVGDPSVPTAEWPDEMKVFGKYIKDFDGEEIMLGVVQPNCDVLVVQRPLQSTMPGLARSLVNSDTALVVELDDDFTSIHPQNISFWAIHPSRNPRRSVMNILETIAYADLVTVSTPALRDVYQQHTDAPVVVIPNYVPDWYLIEPKAGLTRPEDYEGKLLLGWSGSLQTHPVDLQVVGGAVAQVLRENHHVRLTIVGTGKGAAKAFGTKAGGELLTTGWVPLSQYPSVMKELDVGMVPLQMSHFNEGKSWLKGLEWAALGVPFVATPTQQYQDLLITYGAGVCAQSPREWKYKLSMLVQSEDSRHQFAEAGRLAASKLVMQDHLERWTEAWQSARDLKSRSRTAAPTAPGSSSSEPTRTGPSTSSIQSPPPRPGTS